MKNLPILSLLLVLALSLAACGPADTVPGEGTSGIITPAIFATPSDLPGTPFVPLTPETTPDLTPEMTGEVTPSVTLERTPTEAEGTAVTGGTSDDSPHRATNWLDFEVRNYEDDTIGSVEEIIVSLSRLQEQASQETTSGEGQQETPVSSDLARRDGDQVSYIIVNAGGFLGIGQRQVAIPYEALQLQTGEDENDYAFYIDIGQEELEALPEVDLDQVELSSQGWDLNLRTGWEGEAASANDEATPTAGIETPGIAETPTTGGTPDDSEQAGMQIYAMRVRVLLGSEVYDQIAVAPGQTRETTQTPATGTATVTPAAEETVDTDTQSTPVTEGTVLDRDTVVATIEDLIIDLDSGQVQYAVLNADDNLEMGERWIPVPLSAMNILGADDLLLGMGIEYLVQVDRQQLAEAPSFEVGSLPFAEDPDWDISVRDYWDIQ